MALLRWPILLGLQRTEPQFMMSAGMLAGGITVRPVSTRHPLIRCGRHWIFFRPRLSSDQMPSVGLRSGLF
jgi:hypothetical protein